MGCVVWTTVFTQVVMYLHVFVTYVDVHDSIHILRRLAAVVHITRPIELVCFDCEFHEWTHWDLHPERLNYEFRALLT